MSTRYYYSKEQHCNAYPQNDGFVQFTLFKRYIHHRHYLPISMMNYTTPRPRKEVIWMMGGDDGNQFPLSIALFPSSSRHFLTSKCTTTSFVE
jgi:hypothetical protein